jgi:hypothetical protein
VLNAQIQLTIQTFQSVIAIVTESNSYSFIIQSRNKKRADSRADDTSTTVAKTNATLIAGRAHFIHDVAYVRRVEITESLIDKTRLIAAGDCNYPTQIFRLITRTRTKFRPRLDSRKNGCNRSRGYHYISTVSFICSDRAHLTTFIDSMYNVA